LIVNIPMRATLSLCTIFKKGAASPQDIINARRWRLVNVKSFFSARNKRPSVGRARGATTHCFCPHRSRRWLVGLPLRPTELVIFGNPKGGTALMQDRQSAGIDLPLKALVWEDADGNVWLGYNDPAWVAQRHGLGAASAPAVKAMTVSALLRRKRRSKPQSH